MKECKIEDAIQLFENAGFQTFHIEKLQFPIVDTTKLEKFGRTENIATSGELDIFVYYKDAIIFIEFTSSRCLATPDFDTFITKTGALKNTQLLKKFINLIKQKFPDKIKINENRLHEYAIKYVYISPELRDKDEQTLIGRTGEDNNLIRVWGKSTFNYFQTVCNTLRSYSKYELFSYFDLNPKYVLTPSEIKERMRNSTIDKFVKTEHGVYGSTMYTFIISPKILLERSYVLRNEGWSSDSFQRMIQPEKLKKIREYILSKKEAQFSNNIILSLSGNVSKNNVIKPTQIELPYEFCSLCIIDGQHRLLAFTQNYYGELDRKETNNDKEIMKLCAKSKLLATLIVFDDLENKKELLKKETNLFKDINNNQTRIKKDFIYNLEEIITPTSPNAIANKVLKYLGVMDNSVFEDKIEIRSFERGKLKRSSIVTYALGDLVDLNNNFLVSMVDKKIRKELKSGNVDQYKIFCAKKINKYFKEIRNVFDRKYGSDAWNFGRKAEYAICSVSSIIGFLRLYRHFIKCKIKTREIPDYIKRIKVDFKDENYQFRSSKWAQLEYQMIKDIRDNGFPEFGEIGLLAKKYRKLV